MLKKFFVFLFIALCGVGVFAKSSTPTEAEISDFIVNARDCNKNSVQSFLKKYPNYVDVKNEYEDSGNTALINATSQGHTDIVSLLLKAKSDVNVNMEKVYEA